MAMGMAPRDGAALWRGRTPDGADDSTAASTQASSSVEGGKVDRSEDVAAAEHAKFLSELKMRERSSRDLQIQNNKRLMVGLSDKERLKRSLQTEDEAPNIALAPIRWNIDKERRERKADLDRAVDAFEAGAAYRACAQDAEVPPRRRPRARAPRESIFGLVGRGPGEAGREAAAARQARGAGDGAEAVRADARERA